MENAANNQFSSDTALHKKNVNAKFEENSNFEIKYLLEKKCETTENQGDHEIRRGFIKAAIRDACRFSRLHLVASEKSVFATLR